MFNTLFRKFYMIYLLFRWNNRANAPQLLSMHLTSCIVREFGAVCISYRFYN
jgi:hypothetical protein